MNNKWCARNDGKQGPQIKAIRRVIRLKTSDAAFLYNVIEGYEGILTHSTMDYEKGDSHRDLELMISPDFQTEANEMIRSLGDLVVEIVSESERTS